MMWKEFEELAGYEVSYEDYTNVIEPMYMATNLNKRDFIACLDSKRFSLNYKREQKRKAMVKEMKRLAQDMFALCGHTDTYDLYEALREKALEYKAAFQRFRTTVDFETAKGYGNCTYVKALVWYDDKYWNEVDRLELVG